MAKIDKILEIWSDLEDAREANPVMKYKSRKEFLLALIGYKEDGTHKIESLKSTVMSEYEGNEKKCDIIIKILDSVGENLNEVLNSDIKDLNSFVGNLVSKRESEAISHANSINDKFFENLNPYKMPEDDILSIEKLAAGTGFVTDIISIEGTSVNAKFVDLDSDDLIVVIRGDNALEDFTKRYKVSNKFLDKVYNVMIELLKTESMEKYAVFADSSIVNKRLENAWINTNGGKIPLKIKSDFEIGGEGGMFCVHENEYVETPVYVL